MDTTYRKNLKAVLTASKDYTNKEVKKAKNELITLFSKNTVETEDHTNELTYQITAPAGAKLLQLQAIGGSCVKYAPSVASDDSVAKDKVIPEYTYEGYLNYIGGASKVSDNLVLEQKQITLNAGSEQWINFVIYNLVVGETYTASIFTDSVSNEVWQNTTYAYRSITKESPHTFTATGTSVQIRVGANNLSGNINYPSKLMLVKGSTAPTEFSVGFEGMRSAKTTSVVASGNLCNIVSQSRTVQGITWNIVDDEISVQWDGTGVSNGPITLTNPVILKKGTYTSHTFELDSSWRGNIYLRGVNSLGQNVDFTLASTGNTTLRGATKVLNEDITFTNLWCSAVTVTGKYTFKIMVVKGTTAPTTYKPYIAPITKAIPQEVLNDVRYGLGFSDTQFNKLDLITKHLTGEWNIVDLGTLTYSLEVRSGRNIFIVTIPTLKEQVDTNIAINASCPLYRAVPNTATWVDKDMAYSQSIGSQKIAFINNDYTTVEAFKTAMSGVYLLYQTATQFDVDFSQYIDDDFKKFALDNNYTNVELINEYNYDIPNKLEYYGTIKETLCPSITITRNGVDILTRNLPTITSDGYGVNADVHNLRVFSDYEGNVVNKRYTNVNKDTLDSYNYTYESSWGAGADFYINPVDTTLMKKPSDNDAAANVMTRSYTNVSRNTMYDNATDMVMSLLTGGAFKFRNNLYTDATIFKTAMTNEPLYYELADASKTETDMDDFDFFFDVEEGDVITFNNPYAQQVYATYSFLIKEAKSNE